MSERLPTVLEVLLTAFIASKGDTVDLVIEHPELPSVTLEMVQWFQLHLNTPHYRMWCPEDHISWQGEEKVPPSEENPGGTIGLAEEKVGEFLASVLRLGLGRGLLGPNNESIMGIHHDYTETPNGLKIRSTFTFPAKTPQRFINAMHTHCLTEMGHLPEFLPSLYKLKVG